MVTNKDSSFFALIKKLKNFILGSIAFRYSITMITFGVGLVGGHSTIAEIVYGVLEKWGLVETSEHLERLDNIAQIVGIALIIYGIYFFETSRRRQQRERDKEITNKDLLFIRKIINKWSQSKGFNDEEEDWMNHHPNWSESFWQITEETHLRQKNRINKIKNIPID